MKRNFITSFILTLAIPTFFACSTNVSEEPQPQFISADSVNILRDGKPYYFVGTNLWYAPLLGAENGDRERLHHELDYLKSIGVENLRILAGADAGSCYANSVKPYLQN